MASPGLTARCLVSQLSLYHDVYRIYLVESNAIQQYDTVINPSGVTYHALATRTWPVHNVTNPKGRNAHLRQHGRESCHQSSRAWASFFRWPDPGRMCVAISLQVPGWKLELHHRLPRKWTAMILLPFEPDERLIISSRLFVGYCIKCLATGAAGLPSHGYSQLPSAFTADNHPLSDQPIQIRPRLQA
jgi:hypothetical protein